MEDIWRWIWNAISVRDLKYIGTSNIVRWVAHYLNVACFPADLIGFLCQGQDIKHQNAFVLEQYLSMLHIFLRARVSQWFPSRCVGDQIFF